MDRAAYIRLITQALGHRKVAFFGTRGADARTLTDLPNFEQIFSQIAPSGLAGVDEKCLEVTTGIRVDLDSYNVDLDPGDAVVALRGEMLEFFESQSAVVPYRSCALLASATFPRSDRVLHLGNFFEKQNCFEHKPWVETSLARRGIRIVPWRYYADNERALIEETLHKRALVIRSNRSDGGTGVLLVPRKGDLSSAWPKHLDGFLATAPFIEGVPLNVNACVYSDGTVAMFGASLQLIGIPSCTARRFGYCGNDFSAASQLGDKALGELQAMVCGVGEWLASEGYRGAFGIDALYGDGRMHLVELNPRFQGSSRLAAQVDAEDGRSDMLLAHIGAHLDVPRPDSATLVDLARRGGGSHIVVHAPSAGTPNARCRVDRNYELDLEPEPGTFVAVSAMICDVTSRASVTSSGYALCPDAERAVGALLAQHAAERTAALEDPRTLGCD